MKYSYSELKEKLGKNLETYLERRQELENRKPYLTQDLDTKRLEMEFNLITREDYQRVLRDFAGAQEWG